MPNCSQFTVRTFVLICWNFLRFIWIIFYFLCAAVIPRYLCLRYCSKKSYACFLLLVVQLSNRLLLQSIFKEISMSVFEREKKLATISNYLGLFSKYFWLNKISTFMLHRLRRYTVYSILLTIYITWNHRMYKQAYYNYCL